jgi:hemoglobin
MSTPKIASIFDTIGGRPAVSAAIDVFYERVLSDATLAPFFERVDMRRLRGHQGAFLALALGGPKEYRGRAMADAHQGLDIDDEHFDRVAHHLVETLRSLGVTDDLVSQVIERVAPLRAQVVTRHSARPAA